MHSGVNNCEINKMAQCKVFNFTKQRCSLECIKARFVRTIRIFFLFLNQPYNIDLGKPKSGASGLFIITCQKKIKAQFKRRTFHVPNLIPLIKYMKRSTFESIKFNMCNLGRPKN